MIAFLLSKVMSHHKYFCVVGGDLRRSTACGELQIMHLFAR